MIFSELYSAYYNTVAAIISEIIDGRTDEKELRKLVAEKAFGESITAILPSLKSEKWQLVHKDMTTALEHKPTMPLTNLQKSWLKAISLDPRIKLFDVRFDGLEETEPLFTPDDYYIYDKYNDGDPFEDEGYIQRFRLILSAIRDGLPIKLNMTDRNGRNVFTRCVPMRLEYSEKDDKFRLITSGCHFLPTVNLAKITSCSVYHGEQEFSANQQNIHYGFVTLKIRDERNALERCMLHFAHFEKQAEKNNNNTYTVRIRYDRNDESEMVIRVLSFGPMIEVTEPEYFRELIKAKLIKQKSCGLF